MKNTSTSEDDFVELFANVKGFGFSTFMRACDLLNDTKKALKF